MSGDRVIESYEGTIRAFDEEAPMTEGDIAATARTLRFACHPERHEWEQ
jgi:hypothetical protein